MKPGLTVRIMLHHAPGKISDAIRSGQQPRRASLPEEGALAGANPNPPSSVTGKFWKLVPRPKHLTGAGLAIRQLQPDQTGSEGRPQFGGAALAQPPDFAP